MGKWNNAATQAEVDVSVKRIGSSSCKKEYMSVVKESGENRELRRALGAGISIGVLTSGGDAPGMNAAVRAVVAFTLDWRAIKGRGRDNQSESASRNPDLGVQGGGRLGRRRGRGGRAMRRVGGR